MKSGFLNEYFTGVAVKKIVPGEIHADVSNQHELNVNKSLLQLFGKPEEKVYYQTRFLFLNDFAEDQKEADGTMTWYDAREKNPKRSEYRLYFPATAAGVFGSASPGDSLFLCLKPDNAILLIIAEKDSAAEGQLYYLFGMEPPKHGIFESRTGFEGEDKQSAHVIRTVLEKIGIEYEEIEEKRLAGNLIDRFGTVLPDTETFSRYARETVTDADPLKDPDDALVKWYDRETALFKIMERHIIEARLKEGFVTEDGVDTEGFIKFSLSVQNRRKSRAGMSLENNISEILRCHHILFDRTPETERHNKPDFLFPGASKYHDPSFPAERLTMLGAKTTSKDRWRQVLDEADRIERKHLITLEGAISVNQTDQMHSRNLKLVVPKPIQKTYTPEQQKQLLSFECFIAMVIFRQLLACEEGLLTEKDFERFTK